MSMMRSVRSSLTNDELNQGSSSHDENSLEAHGILLEWVRRNGGQFHESVHVVKDTRRGVHIQVKEGWNESRTSVQEGTCVIKTPLCLTMSYFNAIDHQLPDDDQRRTTTFSAHGIVFPRSFIDAVGPGETTAFFLMGQFLRGSGGFWYPYISTLPQPGCMTTPLFYDGEDLEWLEGTSLLPAREQRMCIWREKFDNALSKLHGAKYEDASSYTWDLYLWASTIITSRAFSSKVLSGVIEDSDLPEDRMSVLLPLIDLPNHRPLAKVEWRAGEKDVSLIVLENIASGQEISNNYGPRNNEQLMMNYGFCLPDNSCDYRIVNLRGPPGSPLEYFKRQQQQAFPALATDDEDHYYIFNILYPLLAPDSSLEHTIFSPALFDAVSILAANDRELESVQISETGFKIPLVYGNSRNLLAALSQIIIELITHIIKLRSSGQHHQQPSSPKQTYAKIYRDSQIRLSEIPLIIASWTLRRACEHDLHENDWSAARAQFDSYLARLPSDVFSETLWCKIRMRVWERQSLLRYNGELFKFGDLIHALPLIMQDPCRLFFQNLLSYTQRAIPVLKGTSGQSVVGFPMFLSFLEAAHKELTGSQGPAQGPAVLPIRLQKWAEYLLKKYPPPPEDVAWMLEQEDDENVMASFDNVLDQVEKQNSGLFSSVAGFTGDNMWLSPNWLRWGWMVVEQESVQVPCDPLGHVLVDERGEDSVVLSTEAHLYIPQYADEITDQE